MPQDAWPWTPNSENSPQTPRSESHGGAPRLRQADRRQSLLQPVTPDDLVPHDHRVRAVWDFVEQMDLSLLYAQIQAVEGHVGRAAIDPKILAALWLYATVDGVGSARRLAELCEQHAVYQWICGGVGVNHHTLSDFRTQHGTWLDRMLTQSVAVLMHAGVVDLQRTAQDGLRVRASAGAASFRRERTLHACLEQAQQQVEQLRQELEADPGAARTREQAARARAARERQQRVSEALRQWPDVQAHRKPQDRPETRVSTTDPDARVMKMADGGFRPAFNVQFAVDAQSRAVVGVDVVKTGSDLGQMAPMLDQLQQRHERLPSAHLADGNFAKKKDIEQAAASGVTVYAPVQMSKDPQRDSHTPRPDDSPAVAAWRQRMWTAEAKAIYKDRASSVECVNAQVRNHGLRQFVVRGLPKVRSIALWFALAQNLLCWIAWRSTQS